MTHSSYKDAEEFLTVAYGKASALYDSDPFGIIYRRAAKPKININKTHQPQTKYLKRKTREKVLTIP